MTYLAGTVQDITEMKQMHGELVQHRNNLEEEVKNVPVSWNANKPFLMQYLKISAMESLLVMLMVYSLFSIEQPRNYMVSIRKIYHQSSGLAITIFIRQME